MDQLATGDAPSDMVGVRRSRRRELARERRGTAPAVPDRFRTPVSLDLPPVLPLTKPEPTDVSDPRSPHRVPRQPGPRLADSAQDQAAQEEVDTTSGTLPTAPFARPPTDDIDFGAVIRRADRSRAALRTAWASTGLAGLVLIVYLLTAVPAIAFAAAACAVVAVAAIVVRLQLARARAPRVQR